MLKLKNIVKDYKTGDETVHALKGISTEFRESEFVSILGASGCGKTTLLNIIGGLDKYTSGDLIINGRSTKEYKDSDWDSYRNHSIGFIFQSYNLIPHQTVLSNVELALTISGIPKSKRRKMATDALKAVGLGDQLHKKPNQMSGGQMQRVAIARALVNDPDIILADEPTGALDSETSVQIMEILKKISKNKLIIMVTHNPELAKKYSTRIIRLKDGKITGDTMPYDSAKEGKNEKKAKEKHVKKNEKTSMGMLTALSLSKNNLLTKKGRTFLTSFAGSIGIIGIALILSLSSGMQTFINTKEQEALSNYPIEINKQSSDMSSLLSAMSKQNEDESETETESNGKIYSNNFMTDMITSLYEGTTTNDMKDFKKYIDDNYTEFENITSDIQYRYDTQLNIYKADTTDGVYQVNPSQVMQAIGMDYVNSAQKENPFMASSSMSSTDVWQQLPGNIDTLKSQFKLVDGKYPSEKNQVVIALDSNGKISDYTLYSLGILDNDDLKEMSQKLADGKKIKKTKEHEYKYSDLEGLKFKMLLNTDYYSENKDGTWEDKSDDNLYIADKIKNAYELEVVGIVKADNNTSFANSGGVGYTSDLMNYLVNQVNDSKIVIEQKKDKKTDVFTGIKFSTGDNKDGEVPFNDMASLQEYIKTLPSDQQTETTAYLKQMQDSGMSEDDIVKTFAKSMKTASTDATYDDNLEKLGVSSEDDPDSILLYPVDFDSKDVVEDKIDDYNNSVTNEDNKISYTDYIGLMMSSVTTILDVITDVLIAFVSISLVVSSIMIAIITYISVLERTKEIGILRAMGASKHDISHIFNAEAVITGAVSGVLGIAITIVLDIFANIIIKNITGVANIAALPIGGALILILISILLSFIAGLIPAKMAARRDPVTALRSE